MYDGEPLTQVDGDDFVCNKCLKEFEFVDESYVLKSSEHAA